MPKVFDCFNIGGFERRYCFVVNCTHKLRLVLKIFLYILILGPLSCNLIYMSIYIYFVIIRMIMNCSFLWVKYFFIHPNWLSYRGCGVLVLQLQEIHRSDHALHGHEDVLKDQLDEAAPVILGVAGTVDNAHLLDESRFARLAGTWNKQMSND